MRIFKNIKSGFLLPSTVCLVTKKGANRTMKVKRPLCEQRNMFGVRRKIMWEEQLVDPPIHLYSNQIKMEQV